MACIAPPARITSFRREISRGAAVSHEHLGLFDTPPDRRQVRLGVAVVGALFLASLPVLLLRDVRLPEVDAFYPMVDAVMFVGELITAALLYAQSGVFRSRALAVLGASYCFTALLVLVHALTFPGAFAPNGLLGAGVNTTAWIANLRKWAFAIGIMLYAHFKAADSRERSETEMRGPGIPLQVFAAIVLAAALTILTTARFSLLPPIFSDRVRAIRPNLVGYECFSIVLWVAAIVMLLRRRSSVLDMWLLVALAGWLIHSLVNMTLPGRFTAGYYWVVVIMLFSHLIVMLALIGESTRLYARLALSASAWNREREARLMSVDALAAAISHEVGQPLAAVGIHAKAGLTWLSGEHPNVERAKTSFRATIEAGKLAAGIVKSVRETFTKKPSNRTTFDFADLVLATVPMLQRELSNKRISLHLELDETLPPVLADLVQMQRVLINLLSNAIEALGATEGRPRQITIRSSRLRGQGVVIEVMDNGVGIAREDLERIFDPFFTTKPTGTGLGLALSRVIVEAHGGRLWATRGEDHGASFHLELPGGASQAPTTPSDHTADSPPSFAAEIARL
jgi:signal transduction histidine kinase